jgi:hypothetical protein
MLPDKASAPAFFAVAKEALAPDLAVTIRTRTSGSVAVVSGAMLHWAHYNDDAP